MCFQFYFCIMNSEILLVGAKMFRIITSSGWTELYYFEMTPSILDNIIVINIIKISFRLMFVKYTFSPSFYFQSIDNFMFKMTNVVSFMSCIFYHNFKKIDLHKNVSWAERGKVLMEMLRLEWCSRLNGGKEWENVQEGKD